MQAIDDIEFESGQRTYKTGIIAVSRPVWLFRVAAILIFSSIAFVIVKQAVSTNDIWILFAIIMPVHIIIILLTSWFGYRNPAYKSSLQNHKPLVSIIIPIYNQIRMIELVVDSIYKSSYENIEVIAVNDGSKDGTSKILDRLIKAHPQLKIVHKSNSGKRRSIEKGFSISKGELLVLIDSDSIVHKEAIAEFVKAFNADPKIGAVVGHVKVWNADENLLAKCQECWYDFQFNMQKACESTYQSVTCCSGCLAGYRRTAVEDFIPYWSEATNQYSDDRELTSWVIANKSGRKTLLNAMQFKFLKHASKYDDADDRVLTANAMSRKWKSSYVSTAIVYTDVPATLKQFTRQQIRWKKGYVRTNLFVSTFFWRRNPLMAFLFYFETAGVFLNPILNMGINIYELSVGNYWFPLFFLAVLTWKAFMIGLDQRLRNNQVRSWKLQPLMSMISTFFLGMLVFPALITLRQNKWGTR